MSGSALVLTVASLALAGFIQGLTGFGFGLTAMSLLPLVISVEDTHAIVTLISVAATLTNLWVTVRHFEWAGSRGLMIGSCLGVPLGFWGLAGLPDDKVIRYLGATVAAMVLFDMLASRRKGLRYPDWAGFWLGLVSGGISGAFNVGGPILVAYLYSRDWSKQRNVSTLSAIFLTSGLIRLALLSAAEYWRPTTLLPSAWALGPTIGAILLGNRLLRRVPQERLKQGVRAGLLALSGWYLIAPT